VPVKLEGGVRTVNIPVDAVVMPQGARAGDLPLFFEAKSAGDFTNTNKRRKEEAVKMAQLRGTYGAAVRFEGIDWVWEHRMDDLALIGI
jgi:type II restriction enzyme